jgi:hypothetical protein
MLRPNEHDSDHTARDRGWPIHETSQNMDGKYIKEDIRNISGLFTDEECVNDDANH